MTEPLLERRSPLRASYAMLILLAFFFLLPSAFRGARLSLDKKKNDVKDWLPSDFPETAELSWFARHFAGESFVLATWAGCTSGDQRLQLLTEKLIHESDTYDPAADWPPNLAAEYVKAKDIGRKLELLHATDENFDWAGKREKWLTSASGQKYYITPDGRLYRWEEGSSAPLALVRKIKKMLGTYEIQGQLVTAFGTGERVAANGDSPVNRFYNDPSLICAPLFHSIQTGDTIVEQLAKEGGPLWPIDLTDASRREEVARRLAMQRLTGTLFAPAVPHEFEWTGESFVAAVPEDKRASLPDGFAAIADAVVAEAVKDKFAGSLESLATAPIDDQTDVWYKVFDTAGVTPPPRLTCVLVTLTDLAGDHLEFALGRGVLGGPQGRLLALAEECGVEAAPPPSMAPPPLDRLTAFVPSGKPQLHVGGPPVDNVSIDEEGTVTLVRLVGYSVLVGVVLSYLCFWSVKITLMVFIVGGSSAMLSMAIVYWFGGSVDAILMSMPSLVYVLGLSGAIHVINYYRDEVRIRGKKGAAGRALQHAAMPCFLASATTAIGLASLGISNLAPISNFGIFAALGVIATLSILFSYLPAALQTFAPDIDAPEPIKTEKSGLLHETPAESRLSEAWASVGRWITEHHMLVTVTSSIILVVVSLGMFNMKTSVQLLKLFDPNARIISDYAWLEDNFGKLVPMELVVRVPSSMQAEFGKSTADENGTVASTPATVASPATNAVDAMPMLERVEAVSRIRRVVHRILGEPGLDVVGQAMSADTFLPPLPAPDNSYSPVRSKFNKELIASRADLRGSDYLRVEQDGPFEGSELWRISLRVAALSDVDYGRFISTLRTAVEPVIRAYETRHDLLEKLIANRGEDASGLSGKERVLVLGSKKPVSIDELEIRSFVDADSPLNELIDTQATYLATLAELLAGERMKSPVWLDPSGKDSTVQVGDAKWQQLLTMVDAVVWVGDAGVSQADLAGAKLVIDARNSVNRVTNPTLVGDRIPDVEGAEGLQVVYTGVIPVVYKAQRTLLTSLVESIGSAFVLISLVMMALLNPGRFPTSWWSAGNLRDGIMAGAISMIPNLFPILIVFGALGHLHSLFPGKFLIDIGTMMTASVAMGVAVDDTIHFLSWFRLNLNTGMSRVDAVIETYRRVGPAMTQTTIVGGLGLFVFALSTFTPTQRFGTLMLVLLGTALVGDLIILPALLAGPLGKFFKPRVGSGGEVDPHSDVLRREVPTELNDNEEESGLDDSSVDEQGRLNGTAIIHGEEVPMLRLHRPTRRTDVPHRLK